VPGSACSYEGCREIGDGVDVLEVEVVDCGYGGCGRERGCDWGRVYPGDLCGGLVIPSM